VIALVIGLGYALLYPTSLEKTMNGKTYYVDCGSVVSKKIETFECEDQRKYETLDGLILGVIYFPISFAAFYFINRRRVPRNDWYWRPYKRS
jgi:hypothetical protein